MNKLFSTLIHALTVKSDCNDILGKEAGLVLSTKQNAATDSIRVIRAMPSSDMHNERPVCTFHLTPGGTHPITMWVYWCANYPMAEQWIAAVWPGPVEYEHMLSKWNHFIKNYPADEAMNRFFRDLSDNNQERLCAYVVQYAGNHICN